jgi:hypothetical protein
MCPIYEFKHPVTGEIFEELRAMIDMDKPYIAPDNAICERIFPSSLNGWKIGKEVFEADRDFVKKCNPKYVKYRDGHKERYDPTKHF